MANFVSEFVVHTLHDDADRSLARYEASLRNACESSPPPYGMGWFGEAYRRLTRNPSWFASLLASDAHLEGYSARQLWAYAGTSIDPDFARDLRLHASDEARHSRMFAKLLFVIFPEVETTELRQKLSDMSPRLKLREAQPPKEQESRPYSELLNTVILINLFEAKALVLERLLQPTLLAYCSPENERRVRRASDALIADEVRHVRYTANYLERASAMGYSDYIFQVMADFQDILNITTLNEVEQTNSEYEAIRREAPQIAAELSEPKPVEGEPFVSRDQGSIQRRVPAGDRAVTYPLSASREEPPR